MHPLADLSTVLCASLAKLPSALCHPAQLVFCCCFLGSCDSTASQHAPLNLCFTLAAVVLLVVRCVLLGSTHCMYSSNFPGQHAEQAALHPTEAQQTDVMFLRQLYYGSVGSLAHEHKQLLQQLPSGAAESAAQAATRLTSIRLTAQQLQDKEHTQRQMYLQLLSVYRRGVTMLTK